MKRIPIAGMSQEEWDKMTNKDINVKARNEIFKKIGWGLVLVSSIAWAFEGSGHKYWAKQELIASKYTAKYYGERDTDWSRSFKFDNPQPHYYCKYYKLYEDGIRGHCVSKKKK